MCWAVTWFEVFSKNLAISLSVITPPILHTCVSLWGWTVCPSEPAVPKRCVMTPPYKTNSLKNCSLSDLQIECCHDEFKPYRKEISEG